MLPTPMIKPETCPLKNSYQIPGCIIFYKDGLAYVTDSNLNVLSTHKIEIVFKSRVTKAEDYKILKLKPHDYLFHQIHLCQGKLYVLIEAVLFEVNLFTFTEIAKIPNMQRNRYSPAHSSVCVFNNMILVSNGVQFYMLNNNDLLEVIFNIANQYFGIYCSEVYSFGKYAIACVQSDSGCFIIQLSWGNCKILQVSSHIQVTFCSSGLMICHMGGIIQLVVDLTCEQPRTQYITKVNQRQKVQFCEIQLEYDEETMRQYTDDYDEFKVRRQIAHQDYLKLHNAQSLICSEQILHQKNKFQRDAIIPTMDSSAADIFLEFNSNAQNQLQQMNRQLTKNSARSSSDFLNQFETLEQLHKFMYRPRVGQDYIQILQENGVTQREFHQKMRQLEQAEYAQFQQQRAQHQAGVMGRPHNIHQDVPQQQQIHQEIQIQQQEAQLQPANNDPMHEHDALDQQQNIQQMQNGAANQAQPADQANQDPAQQEVVNQQDLVHADNLDDLQPGFNRPRAFHQLVRPFNRFERDNFEDDEQFDGEMNPRMHMFMRGW